MKKIAIISDTHGFNDYVLKMLEYEKNIDFLIHLGDNIQDYNELCNKMKGLKSLYIIGNHDMEWLEPKEALIKIGNIKIYATHGDKFNIKLGIDDLLKKGKSLDANIILYGHSHIQKCIKKDGILIINPGSISEPREKNCLFSYTILTITDEEIIVESKWANYDSKGIGLEINTVELSEHKDNWKEKFQIEKENLQRILGNKVIQIEHVGSTSIPNMPAKPIIDIVVALDSISSSDFAIKKMIKEGYIYKGPIATMNDRFGFVKGIGNKREYHIYLTTLNSEVWYDYVLARNYIIKHKEAFDEYLNLKTKLASLYPNERKKYTDSKFEFLEQIHKKARKEFLGIDYKVKNYKL